MLSVDMPSVIITKVAMLNVVILAMECRVLFYEVSLNTGCHYTDCRSLIIDLINKAGWEQTH